MKNILFLPGFSTSFERWLFNEPMESSLRRGMGIAKLEEIKAEGHGKIRCFYILDEHKILVDKIVPGQTLCIFNLRSTGQVVGLGYISAMVRSTELASALWPDRSAVDCRNVAFFSTVFSPKDFSRIMVNSSLHNYQVPLSEDPLIFDADSIIDQYESIQKFIDFLLCKEKHIDAATSNDHVIQLEVPASPAKPEVVQLQHMVNAMALSEDSNEENDIDLESIEEEQEENEEKNRKKLKEEEAALTPDEKMEKQLDRWQSELINLDRRNRLLYYRAYKASTVEFKEPTATYIVKQVLSRANSSAKIIRSPEDRFDSLFSKQMLKSEIRAKTTKQEDLKKILRNLERKASQIWLDRGIWILYLGVGLLEWRETENVTDPPVHTPILLYPVELEHESATSTFALSNTDGEISLNPALVAKMKHDFGLDFELPAEVEETDVDAVFEFLRHKIEKQQGWFIKDEAVLAAFSFHKDAMYKDLEANRNTIKANPIIRSIVLGEQSDSDFDFETVATEALDTIYEPEEMNTILDADSSQRQAIIAAKDGKSFILDGPPGTGKSQTIANIIAELMAKGKSILFVSEKAAALDVVNKRLQAANLGDYVLELHSHTATRKELAKIIGAALNKNIEAESLLSRETVSRLKEWRTDLTEWADAVNEHREPLGVSLIEAIGVITKTNDLPEVPPALILPISITNDKRKEVREAAIQLSNSWGPVSRKESFIWDRPKADSFDSFIRQGIIDAVDSLLSSLDKLEKFLGVIADDFSIPSVQSMEELDKILDLEKMLDTKPRISSELLSSRNLDLIQDLLAQKRKEAKTLIDARQAIEHLVGNNWRRLAASTNDRIKDILEPIKKCGSDWFPQDEITSNILLTRSEYCKRNLPKIASINRSSKEITKTFTGNEYKWSLKDSIALSMLCKDCISADRPQKDWIDPYKIDQLKTEFSELSALIQEFSSVLEQVEKQFSRSILELDLKDISRRFLLDYSKHHIFKRQYWKDKKLLKDYCQTSKLKWKDRAVIQLAFHSQVLHKQIKEKSESYRATFGEYWEGEKTDLHALARAIEKADRSLTWLKNGFDLRILRKLLASDNQEEARSFERSSDLIDDEFLSLKIATESDFLDHVDIIQNMSMDSLEAELPVVEKAYKELGNLLATTQREFATINTFRSLEDLSERRLKIDAIESNFATAHTDFSHDFKSDYQDENTDWDQLTKSLEWARRTRTLAGPLLCTNFCECFINAKARSERYETILNSFYKDLGATKETIYAGSKLGKRLDSTKKFDSLALLLIEMKEHIDEIPEALRFFNAWTKLFDLGLANALYKAVVWSIDANRIEEYMDSSILIPWIDNCFISDDRLRNNIAEERNRIVYEFQEIDKSCIKKTPSKIIQVLEARRPRAISGQWSILKHQSGLLKRHKPIKVLMAETDPAIKILKPCFMMSPLSVSQFLPSNMIFDAVIFDEASQIRPSDAVNCIYRGTQLIVAGDPRQLPPTSFFESSLDDGEEYEESQEIEYWESILDMCVNNAALKEIPLNWHYRSKHEHLIAFSNYSFYDGRLVTFPGSLSSGDAVGIEFFYVSDGLYRRSTTRDNIREAQKLARRVIHHLDTNPQLSMGIVALSETQAVAIEGVLEKELLSRPDLSSRVKKDRLSGLFIKNLETVQGDERDIIFISIGYGHDENGRFLQNFGPMNQKVGWRRLNVAITRARQRVEVFASIQPSEIVAKVSTSSIYYLRKYLEYAQASGDRMATFAQKGSLPDHDRESPFEDSVAKAIEKLGYKCVPQVGCSKYRIDLAVCHPKNATHYVLAVECDGSMYHSAKVARDRDRLREQVLVDLGWRVHRIWSSSWYRQRREQEKIMSEVIRQAVNAYDERENHLHQKEIEDNKSTKEINHGSTI